MNVIVYHRVRPNEVSYSDIAIREQQSAVTTWLASNPALILAEYYEPETDGASRPRLAEAIAACKQAQATLLIARTEAIGIGAPFAPRIRSIPVATAPKAIRKIGHIMPAPPDAIAGLSLYFPDHRVTDSMPVYLCNGVGEAIHDVAVTISSTTSKAMSHDDNAMPSTLSPTSAKFELPTLLPCTATLIDHYDPISDGDFITIFEVTSRKRRQRAVVGPGGLSTSYIGMGPSI